MPTTSTLNDLVNNVIKEVVAEFAHKQLKTDELAISLIDLTKEDATKVQSPSRVPVTVSFNGDTPLYPASVVKLFYLVAAHQWLEDKKINETDELKRACKDMIMESSNDATHYIVDLLTGTTAGPELPEIEMTKWIDKRLAINKYFRSLGYENINVCQKTWCEGPYGREAVFVGKDNRNKLTTNAVAKLLSQIVTGQCISSERSVVMLSLLERDFHKLSPEQSADPDNQTTGFMGGCLPRDTKLWSKAGWTSTVRHDAAYIELGNGLRFILVIFVINHANERDILPTIAKKIIHGLEAYHGIASSAFLS